MWRIGIAVMLTAGPALADDWRKLDGAAITQALLARVLGYDDGATQNFHADGATSYDAGSVSRGYWRVTGDQYCSLWPPSDRWECYGVEAEAAGLDLRFVAKNGSRTQGRYIDLR